MLIGHIVDKDNRKPIANVEVWDSISNKSVKTDSAGIFAIRISGYSQLKFSIPRDINHADYQIKYSAYQDFTYVHRFSKDDTVKSYLKDLKKKFGLRKRLSRLSYKWYKAEIALAPRIFLKKAIEGVAINNRTGKGIANMPVTICLISNNKNDSVIHYQTMSNSSGIFNLILPVGDTSFCETICFSSAYYSQEVYEACASRDPYNVTYQQWNELVSECCKSKKQNTQVTRKTMPIKVTYKKNDPSGDTSEVETVRFFFDDERTFLINAIEPIKHPKNQDSVISRITRNSKNINPDTPMLLLRNIATIGSFLTKKNLALLTPIVKNNKSITMNTDSVLITQIATNIKTVTDNYQTMAEKIDTISRDRWWLFTIGAAIISLLLYLVRLYFSQLEETKKMAVELAKLSEKIESVIKLQKIGQTNTSKDIDKLESRMEKTISEIKVSLINIEKKLGA